MAQTVLYLIDTLQTGGTERSLLDITSRLDRNRFTPVVCRAYAGDELEARFTAAATPVVTLGLQGKYHLLRGARRFARLIRKTAPALVHTSLFRSDQIGRLACRWTGTPIVSSLVNVSYEPVRIRENPHLSARKLDILRRVDAFSARWVNRFHAVSQTVLDSNCRHLNIATERAEVIPRGRVVDQFQSSQADACHQLKTELGLSRAAPLFLNVGRLVDQKGQAHLIRAMARLRADLPMAHLLLVGDGWNREPLQQLASQLNIADKITFLGTRRDIPSLLATSDIFVFPSLYEGLPGALVEAMLAGKPIIASDIPEVREVIQPETDGILCPPTDDHALAAAMLQLAHDDERRLRFSTSARRVAMARYDINQVVRSTETFYEQTLLDWVRQPTN